MLLTAGLGFSSIKMDSNVYADESKYEVTYKSDEGYLFGKSDKKEYTEEVDSDGNKVYGKWSKVKKVKIKK
ncbi:hypothetical protein SAMN06297422_10993 [Lachnospiraceae bacterium]|nr:hypothetical protein SAMN06297422_10993 [Lachnospiraceae bacterium]